METSRDSITETQSQHPGGPGVANVQTGVALSTTKKVVLVLILVLVALSCLLMILFPEPLMVGIFFVVFFSAYACVNIFIRSTFLSLFAVPMALAALFTFLLQDSLVGKICLAVGMAVSVTGAAVFIYGSIRERKILKALLMALMILPILLLLIDILFY